MPFQSRAFCALILTCTMTATFGQITYPLPELNDQPSSNFTDAAYWITGLPGFEVFAHTDQVHGRELWRSDGTVEGTGLITDLTPGEAWSDIRQIVTFKGEAHALIGNSIYKTDGTAAGTEWVYTYSGNSYANQLFWVATSSYIYTTTGSGLIRTDGTQEGTLTLAPKAYQPVVLGDLVFFRDGNSSGQLMVTDGTLEGTQALGITVFGTPVVMNGKLYCAGHTGDFDVEPWCSDGTVAGTTRVIDLVPGTGASGPANLTVVGNLLYFSADHPDTGRELYATDGTEMGTSLLKDIRPGPADSAITILGTDGTKLYVHVAGDGVWFTDGTPAGTLPHPSITLSTYFGLDNLGTIGGRLILAEKGSPTTTVYAIDASGHEVLAEFTRHDPAKKDGLPTADSFVRNGLLYFQTFGDTYDLYLWSTDGTPAGTREAVGLRPPFSGSRYAGDGRPVIGENFALFPGIYGGSRDTFATDGSSRHTGLLEASRLFYYMYRGDEVYYTTNTGSYRSDGTPEGTHLIPGYYYRGFHEVDDEVRFTYGPRIYRQNPHNGAVELLADLSSQYVEQFFFQVRVTTEGTWLFSHTGDGFDLWFGDGDGYRKIRNFQTEEDIQVFESMGDRVVFFVQDAAQPGIWQAHRDEVSRISDLRPGRPIQGDYRHVRMGDDLFFCAATSEAGYELWATDGTFGGTRMVADIYEGTAHGVLGLDAVVNNGFLYFSATDADHGTELWRSDGTTLGTTLVADAVPGPESLTPQSLAAYDGSLFFSGVTEAEGRELWTSDGTAPGTRLALDTLPGPSWGNPNGLLGLSRGLVYWRNSDTGYEPWVYRTAPSAHFEPPAALCGGGSYQITAYEDHPEAVYTWTVVGGTILAGQGTGTLTFDAGAGLDVTLSLRVDIDGQMGEHQIVIPVYTAVPATPAPINGPAVICPGDTNVAFNVDGLPDAAAYHWTLPPDALLVSGAGTTDIVVDFGAIGGTVSVVAENPCGQSVAAVKTVTLAVPTSAYAGPHQVVCGTDTVLEATDVPDTTGLWEIVSGSGGMIADAEDPQSAFSGVAGETYRLRWTQTHAVCGSTSDTTVIAVAPPGDLADAGPDQTVCGTYAVLEANQSPAYYGTWEVVSGSGGRFEDTHDPHSLFFGEPEETYVLRWILRGKPCEETADTVQLQFLPAEPVDAGPDLAVAAGAPVVLGGLGEPGMWSVESGPSTDAAQFADAASADTFFTPRGGPGTYVLRRTRTTPGCTPVWDETIVEAFAGTPTPWAFGDIATSGLAGTVGSGGVLLNGYYYFTASNEAYGTALYRTDGAEVTLVADYAPGNTSDTVRQWAVLGDRLYFRTFRELWSSNGTGTGTRLLLQSETDIVEPMVVTDAALYTAVEGRLARYDLQGEGGLVPGAVMHLPLAPFEDRAFFYDQNILWVGDGTTTGSTPLITLPNASSEPLEPNGFAPFDGRTYFFQGGSLYATNGTPGGTVLVKTFRNTGNARTNGAQPPVVFAGKLFFTASSEDAGRELWCSDGTTEGTVLVHDLAPGSADGAGDPVIAGDALYLAAGPGAVTGLWRTDGTSAGFTFISSDVGPLIAVDDRLFFVKNQELWTSDGTGPGTVMLDLAPAGGHANPYPLGVFQGSLFFTLSNSPEEADCYRTLGAGPDVVPLADLHERRLPTAPEGAVLGNILIFAAEDATHGVEPWVSDDAGTRLLVELIPTAVGSNPTAFTTLADRVYFVADSGTALGTFLWYTDGTAAGTHALDFPADHRAPADLMPFGDKLALSLYGPSGREAYLFDPADESFTLLGDVNPGSQSSDPATFTVWRDRLYFTARDGSTRHLYESDGTPEGTGPSPFYTGAVLSETLIATQDALFLRLGSTLYGSRNPDTLGEVVFSNYAEKLFALADRLLILDQDGDHLDVWACDGTAAGTRFLGGMDAVAEFNVGGSDTRALIVADQGTGSQVWTTDGTPEGTHSLQHTGAFGSPMGLGTRTVLQHHTPATGWEFVETDGTHVWRLPELVSGPAAPAFLTAFHGTDRSFLVTAMGAGYRIYALHHGSVPIVDRNLLAHLHTHYDLNDDGFFDAHEASTVTSLSLPDAGIYLLDGIAYLTGLTDLDLSGNQITDPRPLLDAAVGTRAGDSVDLRGNFLDAGDCAVLTVLATRADSAGASFLYHDQGGTSYYPPPWSWPDFNIRTMLGGIPVPPDTLDCPFAPLEGGDL